MKFLILCAVACLATAMLVEGALTGRDHESRGVRGGSYRDGARGAEAANAYQTQGGTQGQSKGFEKDSEISFTKKERTAGVSSDIKGGQVSKGVGGGRGAEVQRGLNGYESVPQNYAPY